MLFLHQLRWSFYSPSILLMWCIAFTGFWILNHVCIPDKNPTWSWCIIHLRHSWIMFLVFCWEHSNFYLPGILAWNFFLLVMSVSSFGIRVMLDLFIEFGSVPSSSFFPPKLRIGINSHLNLSWNSSIHSSGPVLFFVGGKVMINLISFSGDIL